jgi:hypothetical protein
MPPRLFLYLACNLNKYILKISLLERKESIRDTVFVREGGATGRSISWLRLRGATGASTKRFDATESSGILRSSPIRLARNTLVRDIPYAEVLKKYRLWYSYLCNGGVSHLITVEGNIRWEEVVWNGTRGVYKIEIKVSPDTVDCIWRL